MLRPDGRAQEQRAGSARPRPGSRGISQCPWGPPAFPGLQNSRGRAGLLSFPLKPASGLREPSVSWRPELALGFRKEYAWRACVRVLSTQACTCTREGTHACFSEDPWAGLRSCPDVCTRECVWVACCLRVCVHTRMRVGCVCVLPACVFEHPGSSCDPHFMRERPPGPLWRPVQPQQLGILRSRLGAAPCIFGSAL